MRRPRWLHWIRERKTRRAAALAAAQAAQDAAHRAAVQRILAARRNEGPRWDREATVPLPLLNRPLMTPAQRWRGNGGRGSPRSPLD